MTEKDQPIAPIVEAWCWLCEEDASKRVGEGSYCSEHAIVMAARAFVELVDRTGLKNVMPESIGEAYENLKAQLPLAEDPSPEVIEHYRDAAS